MKFCVVEVEVSGEELIDLLSENLPDGVDDALLVARIGKAFPLRYR